MGIDFIWNDNNEFEVWDGEVCCYGFGKEIVIKYIWLVMFFLMCRVFMEV